MVVQELVVVERVDLEVALAEVEQVVEAEEDQVETVVMALLATAGHK